MYMKASRQDEIFEDCLAALLEGRRSIEDSLSLYPSLAERLGPLLETAARVSTDLKTQPLPLPEVQEEIRQRLIDVARSGRQHQAPRPWLKGRWAFLGGALVVVVTSLILIAVGLIVAAR